MRKRILVFLGIILLFQNCADNETSSVYTPKENVQGQHFSLEDFEDAFIRENLEVDWNTYHFRENGDGQEIREYPTKLTISRTLSNGDKALSIKYTVLSTRDKGSGKPDYSILKYVGEDTESLQGISFFKKDTFSGPLYFYGLDGKMQKVEVYKEGTLKETHADKEKGVSTTASKFPSDTGDTGYMDWVKINIFTDWYNVRSNGGWDYSGSTLTGSRWEYVWVPGGKGGSGNTGNRGNYHEHGSGRYGPNGGNAHPFEIILDKSFLGTKADCVYKKLAKLNGNLFKKTIGKFIDDPKYDLTFKVGDCGARTDDACTNANNINSTGNVLITIEDVNQSGLGITALILHEGLHAEIHRYVSRFEAGVDPNNRARLFQLYAHYKGWAAKYQDTDYNWKQVAHHVYIIENYVKKIAASIRVLDGNKYPLSYYMAYGWDGLTSYGYTAKRLTKSENFKNQQLRVIADSNTSICK